MIILTSVLAVLCVVLAAFIAQSRRSPIGTVHSRVRHRVIVTLKTGESFGGVLYEADSRAVVIREAVALSTSERTPVDGELLVFREDVAYVQIP